MGRHRSGTRGRGLVSATDRVAVISGYQPGNPVRARLRSYVLNRFQQEMSHTVTQVYEADDNHANEHLFNRAQALNNAYRKLPDHVDTLVQFDTDTTFDKPEELRQAIERTLRDRQWRITGTYAQLTHAVTNALLINKRKVESITLDQPNDFVWVGNRVSNSGILVIPREAFEKVGGYDERYVGHGADDSALRMALDTLYGPLRYFDAIALHLHHPRGRQENDLHEFSVRQRELTEEYAAATVSKEAMWQLLEGNPSRITSKP